MSTCRTVFVYRAIITDNPCELFRNCTWAPEPRELWTDNSPVPVHCGMFTVIYDDDVCVLGNMIQFVTKESISVNCLWIGAYLAAGQLQLPWWRSGRGIPGCPKPFYTFRYVTGRCRIGSGLLLHVHWKRNSSYKSRTWSSPLLLMSLYLNGAHAVTRTPTAESKISLKVPLAYGDFLKRTHCF